jgi:hypothetical protein
MKKLFEILFLSFLIFSCRNDNNGPQEIKFYHRDRLGNGGYDCYADYLAISNYYAEPATALQLLKYSDSYLDTAHAKLAIEGITFMAKNTESPVLIWNSVIGVRERKYFVITFDYAHSNFTDVKSHRQLNSITIWKHAEPITYYRHYDINRKKIVQTNLIDSILNSPLPIVNE